MIRRRARVELAVVGVIAWGMLVLPLGARADLVNAGPAAVADGFSQVSLGGLAVARDGTGGLVYSATVGGIGHVYLSRLLNGSFQTPVQLDSGTLTSASEPVISADNGGRLLVAFISGGNLYVADALSSAAGLSTPQQIATSASHPAIAMNLYGVGYVAYTAADGSGDDVDVQYFDGSIWTPASPLALNQTPGDVAGTGDGAPSVAAATDGVGIVAWGEGGHVYSRRVWGTRTSVQIEQDDPAAISGQPEVSAGAPDIASGGDSSYVNVVFNETFATGGGDQTRAMLTRLIAERTQPAVPIDGTLPGNENGLQPQIAMGELGRGLITAVTGDQGTMPGASGATNATPTPATQGPYGVMATVLGTSGAPASPAPLSASTSSSDPDAVPAVFGSIYSGLTWFGDSGNGLAQVLFAYLPDGSTISTPIALSSLTNGPVQLADGLELGGDGRGDAVVAWVQGSPGALAIETDQLYTPPGIPGLTPARLYTNTDQPKLVWNPANEDWGPVSYAVTLGGNALASTGATSLQLTTPLTDGTYPWQVTADNAAGQSTSTPTGSIVVDTFSPRLRLRLSGAPRVEAPQRLSLAYVDPPNPGEGGAPASGIKSVTVSWGDGSPALTTSKLVGFSHAYAKPGVDRLSVVAVDRTGNATTLTRLVRVLP